MGGRKVRLGGEKALKSPLGPLAPIDASGKIRSIGDIFLADFHLKDEFKALPETIKGQEIARILQHEDQSKSGPAASLNSTYTSLKEVVVESGSW